MKRQDYFKPLKFTKDQLENYRLSLLQDYRIAKDNNTPQIVLRFSYDCMIKLAISELARQGYKVRSIPGHHIALLDELAEIVGEADLAIVFNEYRQKRNRELYDGYCYATETEAHALFSLLESILTRLKYI